MLLAVSQELEIEDEIERVEQRANELKKMIDPRNLKPTLAIDMKKKQNAGNVGRFGDVNKSLASLKSPFNQLYKSDELGKVSKNGRRFSDRIKLGKNPAKIVSVELYENK